MITLFQADETIFSHDGVEVLDDIVISSYTSWGENGKWVSESKFKKDYDKSESIKEGMILQLPTEKGLQLFRILKLNKKNKKYITTTGQHIAFDFENNFIQDINIVEKSGRAAIKQIQGGTVFNSKYNLTSNIDTVASARMVRKNGITSLVGSDDNCFINRWGGYLVLDNFNISMNTSVGQDRGVEVLIGKNLTDMEGSIDISSVVTGINPITYDGLTLPEGIYYSPLVNNYPEPRIKEFKFDDIKYKYSENNYDEEGYETLEEVYEAIRKACDDLYNNSNIDKPTCNLRVSIIDLTKTDQYKGIELNERIFQGDIVTANLEEYGFNVKLKMTANKYNNIKDCYEDFDLGDVKTNVFSSIDKVQSNIDKVVEQLGGNTWQDILDKSMQEAAQLIEAGIKDSYVVARKNEILIMDSPQVESSINVIRMNKNGIAFSQSGYNGPYTLAITIDGKINASVITTGELNAALIKTGTLMSANGKTWINMEDGTFNFADKMKFNGTNFEVDLSNEGLATEEDIGNVIFKFSNSGGDNIIENGQFLDNINSWLEYISDFNGINGNRSVITPSNEWCIDGRNCLQIKATNSTTGHYGMVQSLVLKRNCTYTLNGYNASHRCLGFVLIQRSSGDYKIFSGGNLKGGIGGKSDEAWDKWSFTFTTDDGNNGYNIYLGITECGEDAYCWYTDLMLSEGSVRRAYVPNSKELYNGKTVINRDGLTVYDGGIKIKNQLNNDVMWCDSEGWLTCNKLNTYGTEASIEIGSDSPGNKGLGIRSPNDSATLYLDFSPCVKGTDFTTIQNTSKFHRIATYGGKRDTLFLEVGAKLEIRKSKLDGLPVSMLVQGTIDSSDSISTQRNVTATGRVTAGGFAMSNGNTLIATDTISTIKYANNGAKSYIEVATPNFGTWGADLWASDERLKTNINDSDFTAINTILSINHIEFDYKDEILNTSNLGEKSINTMSLEETVSGRHIDVGYSAQQLYELDSNLVLEVPQEDGSILYQPRASAILPIATKAIQEQQEYIKKLENDITYFKNELEEIKSFLGI